MLSRTCSLALVTSCFTKISSSLASSSFSSIFSRFIILKLNLYWINDVDKPLEQSDTNVFCGLFWLAVNILPVLFQSFSSLHSLDSLNDCIYNSKDSKQEDRCNEYQIKAVLKLMIQDEIWEKQKKIVEDHEAGFNDAFYYVLPMVLVRLDLGHESDVCLRETYDQNKLYRQIVWYKSWNHHDNKPLQHEARVVQDLNFASDQGQSDEPVAVSLAIFLFPYFIMVCDQKVRHIYQVAEKTSDMSNHL